MLDFLDGDGNSDGQNAGAGPGTAGDEDQRQAVVGRLLLKLLSKTGGSVFILLDGMGVDVHALAAGIRTRLSELPHDIQVDTSPVMSMAQEESMKRGEPVVRSVDMLLALLRMSGGIVAAELEAAGVDYDRVSRKVGGLAEPETGDKQPGVDAGEDEASATGDGDAPGMSAAVAAGGDAENEDHGTLEPARDDEENLGDTQIHFSEELLGELDFLDHVAEGDPELEELIDSWPALPDPLKRGILAMARDVVEEAEHHQEG